MKLKPFIRFIKLKQERGESLSYKELISSIELSRNIFFAINGREPTLDETITQMVKDLENKPPFLV